MNNLESNKIFAAILIAGIVAMLAGFVAEKLVEVDIPDHDAVTIEGGGLIQTAEAATPAGPEPILSLIASADVAQGEKLSKACAACHSFGKGEPNKVGPNLWGIVGGKHAHIEGFAYSDAFKGKAGTPWTYEELNEFLWKPKQAIPGTKMGFAGLKKPEERAALIAWLRTISSSPAPLPSDADIKAEAAKLAPTAPATDAAPAAEAAEQKSAAPAPAAH